MIINRIKTKNFYKRLNHTHELITKNAKKKNRWLFQYGDFSTYNSGSSKKFWRKKTTKKSNQGCYLCRLVRKLGVDQTSDDLSHDDLMT